MRIMISAGGTGGGVYPAFAVAEALQDDNAAELIFVGGLGKGGMEPDMIARSELDWIAAAYIMGGPVHGVSPLELVRSTAKLAVGLLQALRLVRRHRPDSVFLTGGWASLPVALGAWLQRVPVYSFVPDIEPGLTLKVASRFTRQVAATVQQTDRYFRPGLVVETGYPLRRSLQQATREAALAEFGLDPARRMLLVTGGSSGARSINQTVLAIAPLLLEDDSLQILHITGRLDWPAVQVEREKLPAATQARYHTYEYLHDTMGLALAAADLVVSRAGASTLGEFPYFGLPAILVPYPYAWRYQKVNADYLVVNGAAVRLDDERLGTDLYPAIRGLFDDPAALARMAGRARALARPDGAQNIARLLSTAEAR